MRRLARALAAATALAAPGAAHALFCTAFSTGLHASYLAGEPSHTVVQASVTVLCVRTEAGDPTTVDFTLAADDGRNRRGQTNRARLGGGRDLIDYDVYRDASCALPWGRRRSQRIEGSMVLSGYAAGTQTVYFWGCVPAGQRGKPAGTYLDAVLMRLRYNRGGTFTSGFPVVISTLASCSITSPPGTVAFLYEAFGPQATAGTTFGVTCTRDMPYTISLDAASGVVAGLNYTLSLSTTEANGTGVQQNHAVSGTMPGSQAGACPTASCVDSRVHTITISY